MTVIRVLDLASDEEATAALFSLARTQGTLEYSVQAQQVDLAGNVVQDVSEALIKTNEDEMDWDCIGNVQGSIRVTLDSELGLRWGSDILAFYQLIRSTEYNATQEYPADTYLRFPLGHFVMTSPGHPDLDAADQRQATGFDVLYLLQNQPSETLSFDAGTTYVAAITAIFLAAGLITSSLSEVCDFPGDYVAKMLPDPSNTPLGTEITYLDVVNGLLKASGCRPLYGRPDGRFRIDYTTVPSSEPLRWRWFASEADGVTDDDLDAMVVLARRTAYNGDVWNVPNRWIFIQSGLTFEPIAGSGMYVVDNTSLPPSDQATTGRVLVDVQTLQASDQTDLETQGNAIVTAALSQAEKLTLVTDPWPGARHYDVFQVTHQNLPNSPIRRVQAQRWTLPLWGGPMTWQTNVVAAL